MTVSINGDTGVSAVQDNIVTADKIATGAITVADIPDGEITSAKLASGIDVTKLTGNSELVPLAWVVCGNTDGSSETTIIASYGVSSVTDAEVGANHYNYSETQPSGTYRVIVASQDNSGWNAGRIMITGYNQTSSFRVRTWDAAGTNDDAQHHAIVFGETS